MIRRYAYLAASVAALGCGNDRRGARSDAATFQHFSDSALLVLTPALRRLDPSAADTIREIVPATVRHVIRDSARVHANRRSRTPGCTRFFGAEAFVIALFDVDCPDTSFPILDAQFVAVFAPDGRVVGEAFAGDAYVAVCPARRDAVGRAFPSNSGGYCSVAPHEVPGIPR